jgi:hypothetical protein
MRPAHAMPGPSLHRFVDRREAAVQSDKPHACPKPFCRRRYRDKRSLVRHTRIVHLAVAQPAAGAAAPQTWR